jgi:hypothetical protein
MRSLIPITNLAQRALFGLVFFCIGVRLSQLRRAALILLILGEVSLASVPAAVYPHDQYAQYSAARANSDAAMLSNSDRVVRRVQITLRQLGYDTGPITAFMGEKTQIAIQMFEVDHCYPVRPEINRRLLIWLGIRDLPL